jgi:hypothetical protein
MSVAVVGQFEILPQTVFFLEVRGKLLWGDH